MLKVATSDPEFKRRKAQASFLEHFVAELTKPVMPNEKTFGYLGKNPQFALGAAMASLKWLAYGWGYEITGLDVLEAYKLALAVAKRLGVSAEVKNNIRKIIAADQSVGSFVQKVLGNYLCPSYSK